MALTQLDTNAALVVIDLQKGITGMVPTAAEVVGKSAELLRAFRKKGLPVVLVNVTAPAPGRRDVQMGNFAFPPDWADLVPELEQQPEDILISKQRVGAFLGTELHEKLQERGVTQVFFTGIATGSGVEASARSAFDYGYNVVFVVDAMADRDPETHRFCVEKVFPKIGETTTKADALAMLGA